ncbi:hypothetical protein [Silvanigrella aquatica]|uniref:Uncharacterized protein n=1 Tax=Silvanigrella aquatica TaxID=1915309 RepID=A0A1L4CZW2_9BACT|nr:hypothetical protein [Silvanigrella aquatica]APJ03489.1 hypothetical protein AXG55_06040 [Silvanigrella aquatica]
MNHLDKGSTFHPLNNNVIESIIKNEWGLTQCGFIQIPQEGVVASNFIVHTKEKNDILIRTYRTSYSKEQIFLKLKLFCIFMIESYLFQSYFPSIMDVL